jgi:hypothetical protein
MFPGNGACIRRSESLYIRIGTAMATGTMTTTATVRLSFRRRPRHHLASDTVRFLFGPVRRSTEPGFQLQRPVNGSALSKRPGFLR